MLSFDHARKFGIATVLGTRIAYPEDCGDYSLIFKRVFVLVLAFPDQWAKDSETEGMESP
jgi:hypothetical protein